jgi:Fe2+ or Zn2+ uptake regulation protein
MKHNRDHVMQIVKEHENIGHAQIKELYEKKHQPITAHALSRALATLVDYQLLDRILHGNQPCTYVFIGGKKRFSQSPKIAMFDRCLASVGVNT